MNCTVNYERNLHQNSHEWYLLIYRRHFPASRTECSYEHVETSSCIQVLHSGWLEIIIFEGIFVLQPAEKDSCDLRIDLD